MSEKRPDVIGSLPSTRPHRRSGKRAPAPGADAASPRAGAAGPAAKKPPANIRPRRPRVAASATPPSAAGSSPAPECPGTLETLAQAAAELTEIGLRASARALRGAVSRLPRP